MVDPKTSGPALGHFEWSAINDPTRRGADPREHPEHFEGACPTCGQTFLRAEVDRLREILGTIAAQHSGVAGSTARADCMAVLAQVALTGPA